LPQIVSSFGFDVKIVDCLSRAEELARQRFYHLIFIDLCWSNSAGIREAGLQLANLVEKASPSSLRVLHSQYSGALTRLQDRNGSFEAFVHNDSPIVMAEDVRKIACAVAPYLISGEI
jgi:hypothetical protein